MKTLLLLFCLFTTCCSAQDFLSGRLFDQNGNRRDIFYDRTQNDISLSIYQTVYKITDLNKKVLYTLTLSHDRTKGIILTSVKTLAGQPNGSAIRYNKNECGLIFNDQSDFDTEFDINADYKYLVSFTDTGRTYPVVHKFKLIDNSVLVLDPLSKLRIKKHTEIINSLPPAPNEDLTANRLLLSMRDSLYAQSLRYHNAIDAIRSRINTDVAAYMEDRKVEQDKKRYEGAKRFGNAHGKGMLVVNGSIYDGDFSEGKFIAGCVTLRTDEYEYCGEFKNDTFNGTGWLKFKNGSYLLGTFVNGELSIGIALQKEKNGEIYFGGYNGKRNGFGEFQNAVGGKYTGQFASGRLSKGYAKEVDPFGYYTYSYFDSGTKTTVDTKIAEEFFGLSLSER